MEPMANTESKLKMIIMKQTYFAHTKCKHLFKIQYTVHDSGFS